MKYEKKNYLNDIEGLQIFKEPFYVILNKSNLLIMKVTAP